MSKYPRTDAARLKDVCRHMAMAEECTRMEYELNEAKARIKRLEEALQSIREYWNRDNNSRAMIDACWYAIDKASEALEVKEAKP